MRGGRQVAFWIAALIALVVLVALLRDALLPFVAGAVIAYFLNPAADRLERIGISRPLAAILMVGLSGLVVVVALVLLVPLLFDQLGQLAARLPTALQNLAAALEAWAQQRFGPYFPALKQSIDRSLAEVSQGSSAILAELARSAWSRGVAIFNVTSLFLVTPIVVFYLLRDWPRIVAQVDASLPRAHADTIRGIGCDIDGAVGAFIRGQGTICLVLAVLYAVALTLAGLKYGLAIGIATGVLAFIPVVGWMVGLATATLAALSQTWPDPTLALWIVGIFVAGMAIDAALLSPTVVGQRIGLHPVWLILALFSFSALLGFVGTLIAVPVAAALAVIVRFARDRYLESDIYLGEAGDPPQAHRGPET
ncbi:MAG: AI-2E family transporter [Hyphomicrobiaceae bacterium]|nr:AI-2E family transporter [Hyphomicrobiaceae bacterium]